MLKLICPLATWLHPPRLPLFHPDASKTATDGQWGCGRPHGCFDEPFVVQLPDGTVQINMRNDSLTCDPQNCCCAYLPITHPRSIADSSDGGLTFGPSRQIADLPEPTGGCQASSILVGGSMLYSGPAGGGENRTLLTLRRSDDGGRSYPHSTVVEAGPGGYSCLTRLGTMGSPPGSADPSNVGLAYERSADGCAGGS